MGKNVLRRRPSDEAPSQLGLQHAPQVGSSDEERPPRTIGVGSGEGVG